MTLVSVLGRAVAVAAVVAGIVLLTLAVQGMTRVDTRLDLAAAEQVAPKFADCPFRDRGRGDV
jgi:hypothetical protein